MHRSAMTARGVAPVPVVRQLTPRQLALGRAVCERARTLHDRLRVLGQLSWDGAQPADVTAVRGWLFEVHRDDEAQGTWADLLDAAE